MQNKSCKCVTGFRNNHDTQNSFLRMIESLKAKLKNCSKVGVIITDLSKALTSLNHDFVIGKTGGIWFR